MKLISFRRMKYLLVILSIIVLYMSINHHFSKLTIEDPSEESTDMRPPVVVVGSGLAGLSSAYTLLLRNVPVVLLEKGEKFGGNSMKASSGINGMRTETQKLKGIEDSFEVFYNDTINSAKHVGDKDLQRVLVNDSTKAIDWLKTSIGVPLNVVNRLGGHSQTRTHRSEGVPPGFEIISKLLAKVKEQPGIELHNGAKLTGLDIVDNKVKGVKYLNVTSGEESTIKASNVVIATGGFGYSKELLSKYTPHYVDFPTTNDKNTQGEGQVILENAGGELIDMEYVQIHPTGFIKKDDPQSNWKFLAAESLRGIGGILLNAKFDRFVNELDTRDAVSKAILAQEGKKAYLVLSDDMYKDFKFQIDFYKKMNLIEETTLSEKFGDDSAKVIELLREYSNGSEDQFGRKFKQHVFPDVSPDTTLYIGEVTPVVHFTMGGVKIDINGEVLNKDGVPIEGLYAAGEVSGGVHGKNRLGGNSLLECVVFGTRAGEQIAEKYKL